METTVRYVPLIRRPRSSGGVQWGNLFVLCKRDNKELWRITGSSIKRGVLFSEWVPGEITLVGEAEEHFKFYKPSCCKIINPDSSRFSRRLMTQNASKIFDFFGCDVAGMIRKDKTLIIEGGNLVS